jgi:hypothetical protein
VAKRLIVEWFTIEEKQPPKNERLLLIVSAAGDPPDVQLMGKYELVIGYWDGHRFHPVTLESERSTIAFDSKVHRWATLRNAVPKDVMLRSNFLR